MNNHWIRRTVATVLLTLGFGLVGVTSAVGASAASAPSHSQTTVTHQAPNDWWW